MSDKLYKSIKYRIFPNEEQKIILERYFGVRRFTYNYLVNLIFETEYLKENIDNKNSTSKLTLRDYIRKNGPEWIRGNTSKGRSKNSNIGQINVTVVENAVEDFVIAFNSYKKKSRLWLKENNIEEITKNRPKIKSKKESTLSCMFNRKDDFSFKIIDGQLNINTSNYYKRQTFLSKRKITLDQNKIKQVSFNKINGKYYMGIVYETQVLQKPYKSNTKIGIDLGMKTSAVCYDGNKYFNYKLPIRINKINKNLIRINSKFSQAKNDSKRKIKLLKRLNKIYKYKINFRNNWQDHIVCDLCKKYETIIIDDMPKLSKGFNKHNNKKMSIAPGRFIYRLNNKSQELQNNIIIVKSGTPTTQTCSNCGNIKQKEDKLTLNDRTYECKCCGYIKDRDENSAKNIYNYKVS